jgi:hypothetical protein
MTTQAYHQNKNNPISHNVHKVRTSKRQKKKQKTLAKSGITMTPSSHVPEPFPLLVVSLKP